MWNVEWLKRFLEWIKTTSWCSTLAIGGKDGGRLEFDFWRKQNNNFFPVSIKISFYFTLNCTNLTMLIYKSHWWVFITNVSRSCLTLEASSFFCGFNVNFEFSHDSELFSMLNFWVFWRVVFKQGPTRYRLQAWIKFHFPRIVFV